jgi:4-hydroxythreonine-4-phosphate dehydrogenase
MTLPIALTSGDPSGVGPEITVKAWSEIGRDVPFYVIGDVSHYQSFAKKQNVPIAEISSPEQISDVVGLPILHQSFPAPIQTGSEQPLNANAIIQSIQTAVEHTRSGKAGAICTNPINKKVLKDGADFPHPGHTEFLASLGEVERSVMMLLCSELKVVPVTIHIALQDVPNALTDAAIKETIEITHEALLHDFGIDQPRIAVAGLNPHAGEGGAMGMEEINNITPLLNSMREQGMDLLGPLPADTMFHSEARATYDAAVCMYHDQALIPIKTLDFAKGVNVTLGLPFVRTSPDHGTAFDIAGKGIANPSSLIEALKTAKSMVKARNAT